ncbi:MAG TPA: hypothetical protein VJN21_01470 [Candidatus Acidoferrales bacterium]|nr:hypothetical protein [Candidatus Acidoferrales bacterium]
MRIQRFVSIFLASLLISVSLNAQQTTSVAARDPIAASLLQRSLAALTGTATVNDVTLSGNANWIAGSDNETGSATLKATALAQRRVELSLSGGQRSEVVDASQAVPTGSWCGTDGTWHAMVAHNLYTDPTWFFPTFLISRALTGAGYAISPADAESLDSIAVEHIVIYQPSGLAAQQATKVEGLGEIDLYLNASTLLPVRLVFNVHADTNLLVNIQVAIDYSNYQVVQGVSVPYHIQKYINNGLALDLTVSNVQVNSGLSASDFQAQ